VKDHPGDYRVLSEGGNKFLRLTGGLHVNDGWAQVLRVTQRVPVPVTPLRAASQVRTEKDVRLRFEICEKHLLYTEGCQAGEIVVKAAPGIWQPIDIALQGDGVSRGLWYAPRIIAFSVAVGTGGGVADLDQLQLLGTDRQDMLINGSFSADMAHWFSSSDKHHLPWHTKNMFLHVLFEQGVIGVVLWSMLLVGALLHLSVGKAKTHPLAPVVTGSLVGFSMVGLFDSLLDVPRVAMLFYFLVLIGLTLTPKRQRVESGGHKEAIGT
jgi:hypothetical protein